MLPTRLQRSGATLDEVRAAVRAEFGGSARIVAAERVTTGGIAGLFRKAHVEATVEVLDPAELPTARVAIADGPARRVGIAALLADAEDADRPGPPRAGIAALLADAEEAEARIAGASGAASTRAEAFASVLDGFAADGIAAGAGSAAGPSDATDRAGLAPGLPSGARTRTGGPDHPGADVTVSDPVASSRPGSVRPSAPAVRQADGDLVLLVGRTPDVDAVAAAFAERYDLRGTDARDRRAGILARAEGVREGHALLAGAAWTDGAVVEALAPDQVWAVVDAGRKHDDTAAMVRALLATVPLAGLVVVGAGETASPDTVHLLGLPVLTL